MRFIAEAASTEVDLRNEHFAPQALYQMAEQADGKEIPIVRDFDNHDRVGFVDSVKVVDNRLIIEGELHVGRLEKPEGFVVPGIQVRQAHYEEDVWVETDVRLVSFGLTQTPCDAGLKPLREMAFKKCTLD